MPKKSELRDAAKSICLVLCGKNFVVELDDNTVSKCQLMREGAELRLGQLRMGLEIKEVTDEGICEFLHYSIDSLLGEGAVCSIFGERPINLEDITQLACYVVSKLSTAFDGVKAGNTAE